VYIKYRNNRLQILLNNEKKLTQEYGPKNARKIVLRLSQITAMPTLGHLLQSRLGRCHALQGDYAGMYAMDLEGGFRLIFRPVQEKGQANVSEDLFTVEIVMIMEVTDYHG